MKKILHIVGGRPNFMKMAPVFNAFKPHKSVKQVVVHTGQHYSANMSDIFFKQLNIKKPDINLEVGSGSHASQVADIMKGLEVVFVKQKPDMIIVYGDMNSTMAGPLVASKMGIPVAHVEAGLRSFDLEMPEEINRMVTDVLASVHFITEKDAEENLLREGVSKNKIHFVGNTMIDTLHTFLPTIRTQKPFDLKHYGVVTLHRPSNVDDPAKLKKIIGELQKIGQKIPLVFPIHPRTRKILEGMKGFSLDQANIRLVDPMGYTEFMHLVHKAELVITDSGGIQEETTYLGVPCLTLRKNTERPVTVKEGTNTLVGDDFMLLHRKVEEILKGHYKKGKIPPKWDGKAAQRIASILIKN